MKITAADFFRLVEQQRVQNTESNKRRENNSFAQKRAGTQKSYCGVMKDCPKFKALKGRGWEGLDFVPGLKESLVECSRLDPGPRYNVKLSRKACKT